MVLASGWLCHAADGPARSVTVSAQSEVKVVPDEVLITFTVANTQGMLLDAKALNDATTQAVLDLAADLLVPVKDIAIVDMDVSPVKNRAGELVGYSFERSMELRSQDFGKIEPLLSGLIKAGVDRIEGLEFRTSDQRKFQVEARRLAVEYAREKATHLAELNGLQIGDAVSIQEDVEYNWNAGTGFGMGGMGGSMTEASQPNEPARTASRPKTADVLAAWGPASWLAVAAPAVQNPAEKPAATQMRDNKANKLLAPGQISLNATVTIEFELLKK
jgi:uncharacterized protein YggE